MKSMIILFLLCLNFVSHSTPLEDSFALEFLKRPRQAVTQEEYNEAVLRALNVIVDPKGATEEDLNFFFDGAPATSEITDNPFLLLNFVYKCSHIDPTAVQVASSVQLAGYLNITSVFTKKLQDAYVRSSLHPDKKEYILDFLCRKFKEFVPYQLSSTYSARLQPYLSFLNALHAFDPIQACILYALNLRTDNTTKLVAPFAVLSNAGELDSFIKHRNISLLSQEVQSQLKSLSLVPFRYGDERVFTMEYPIALYISGRLKKNSIGVWKKTS